MSFINNLIDFLFPKRKYPEKSIPAEKSVFNKPVIDTAVSLPEPPADRIIKKEINIPMDKQELPLLPITVTRIQLKKIAPFATGANIDKYLPYINEFSFQYKLTTKKRMAAYLAQILHESGSLFYVKEIASGKAYEGRRDLGNIHPGDGVKYKGRGILQITGRKNYELCSIYLFGDARLLDSPELLEEPKYAVLASFWFWETNDMNKLADTDGIKDDTRKVNGGYNGLKERQEFFDKAMQIL